MATAEDMINAHLTWMRAGSYATNTVDDARKLLLRAHRELPEGLHGSTGDELAIWLDNPDWSRETRLTYYKHLIRLYRWATNPRDPWMTFDPSADLRRPTAPAGLPRPAPLPVVQAAVMDTTDPWRIYCRLAAFAGARSCEIARLRRDEISEVVLLHGKGGKVRAVPTHPLIAELVADLPPGPIVRTPSGITPTGDWVSSNTARYLRVAGIPTKLYPLRHFFASWINEKHRDIRVVQELLGHASVTTAQRYTAVTASQLREAVNTLPFVPAPSGSAGGGTPVREDRGGDAPPPRRPGAESGPAAVRRGLLQRRLRRTRP
ncbi:tyrosine-type recombinase/integrase [Micromonospora haikouensis]|uniref:tyrosine-type recombinase/integrase n=1 Tax=Micromonospora haikouensis TaxID=686309 RepID=UPI003D749918